MKIVYTDVLVIGGGLAGLRMAIGRQAPRPRRDHPVAGAAEALAFGGRAGRHAGDPRQRDQGPGRQRGRALRGHGARQRLGRRPARGAHVREHRAQGGARARRVGRAVEPRAARATAKSSSTARRSRSPSATRRTACSRSATSAAPRNGAPATSPTAPATRCCYAMSDQAIAASIPVHERTEALALIHDGGRCYGAIVRNLITGELTAYVAKATAIATGGAGRLYRVDDQRGHLRRHRHGASRSRPASPRSATWRRCSSIRPPSSRPASS